MHRKERSGGDWIVQTVRQDSSGHTIRKNTVLSLLTSGIGYLYPIIAFIHIARILHPEGLGRISFTSSITAYFVMFTGLGMPIYGMRATAARKHSPQELSRFVAEMLLMRFLTGFAVWGIFLLAECMFMKNGIGEDHRLLMIFGTQVCMDLRADSVSHIRDRDDSGQQEMEPADF